MFYKMSEELKTNIRRLLLDVFTEEKLNVGIEAFENLINIENDKSSFDKEYGKELNESNILSIDWNVVSGNKTEGLLRKIEMLKGKDTEGTRGLSDYYKMIGFYKWLDADDVKAARALDPINCRNVQNDPGKGFLFDDVDASIYKGCSHFLDSYIVVRQKRNKDFHNEGGFEDPVKRMAITKS